MLIKNTRVCERQKSSNLLVDQRIMSVIGRITVGLVILMAFSFEAHAQFVVQPMVINAKGRPGSLIRKGFKLENRRKDESQYVTLEIVDLFQDRKGDWAVLDSDMVPEQKEKSALSYHASCKDWISIGRIDVEVSNYGSSTEKMAIKIPRGVRGFYCAGLKVALAPRPGLAGVLIKYEFVVPICVTIEGPSLRSRVALEDADILYVEQSEELGATTGVGLKIKNSGSTYSLIMPRASVYHLTPKGRSRVIKRDLQFPARKIIPGGEFDLFMDLKNSLPSGTYKVAATLNVDGRRVKGLNKTIEFENPGLAGEAHLDASMRVNPTNVEFEMAPGRVDNQRIVISNFSDEDIVIKAVPVVPDGFLQKVSTLRGEDLSCANWITIRPDEIPIRAGGQRNVSVSVRMPKEQDLPVLNIDLSNYYASLKFYGFYRDRTSAGVTSSLVNVTIKGADPIPSVQERECDIRDLGNSKFKLLGTYVNFGMIHVTPVCRATIRSEGDGLNQAIQYANIKLENDDTDSILMPFETRTFSADMDFGDIPVGRYVVETRLDYGRGQDARIITSSRYDVIERDGKKVVFEVGGSG